MKLLQQEKESITAAFLFYLIQRWRTIKITFIMVISKISWQYWVKTQLLHLLMNFRPQKNPET